MKINQKMMGMIIIQLMIPQQKIKIIILINRILNKIQFNKHQKINNKIIKNQKIYHKIKKPNQENQKENKIKKIKKNLLMIQVTINKNQKKNNKKIKNYNKLIKIIMMINYSKIQKIKCIMKLIVIMKKKSLNNNNKSNNLRKTKKNLIQLIAKLKINHQITIIVKVIIKAKKKKLKIIFQEIFRKFKLFTEKNQRNSKNNKLQEMVTQDIKKVIQVIFQEKIYYKFKNNLNILVEQQNFSLIKVLGMFYQINIQFMFLKKLKEIIIQQKVLQNQKLFTKFLLKKIQKILHQLLLTIVMITKHPQNIKSLQLKMYRYFYPFQKQKQLHWDMM